MRTLKRLGASALALGVATAGMVMTAPLASAHTGTLTTSSVCQDDGSQKITYTGETFNVPESGDGHVATLTVGEIKPDGTMITDAPATVTGNTTYTFHQTVPGTATYAQATAFLVWGDGVKSDPIGTINLPHNCSGYEALSGSYTTVCTATGANVVLGRLNSGTRNNVVWTLTHGGTATVVTSGQTLAVSPGAALDLSWRAGSGGGNSVQHGTAPYACPPEVPATGSYTTVCTATGANVVVGSLNPGSNENVVWTLTYGAQHKVVTSGETVPVPSNAALDLSYQAGTQPSHSVQHGNAPDACPPEVPATGSFTVVCTAVGANVTIGTLDSGTHNDVVWTLAYGSASKTVHSADVVAVPALAALALKYKIGGGPSTTVQEGPAPAACTPPSERSLDVVKSVTPTGDAAFGDTLTYQLKVTAGGNLGQTAVVVTDYIPGYKPGRESGKTTYVPGSATCDAGTCSPAYDDAAKLVTWGLGDMAPGTSRTVTFQVTIDTPAATDGGIPATTIFNSGAVGSTQTSTKPSNEVQTPVTAVLGVKQGKKPVHHTPTPNQPTAVLGTSLPHTGAPAHLPWTLGFAALFLLMGSALILVARTPEVARER